MKGKAIILSLALFALLLGGAAGQCQTDEDCVYNGVCVQQECLCDPGWEGPQCTNISFLPAPVVGAFGYDPNVTAWGGVPVLLNGTYHLLVSEMVDGCGLCTWGSNSRIVHATSDTLLGPYTYQAVALPVWAHNPQIVLDDSSGTPIYLLFHIGYADGGTPKVCNASGEDISFSKDEKFANVTPSGILHTAPSPWGPWTPQNPPGLGLCNNPAPYVFKNGSIHVVCDQGTPNIFYADSWEGPWTATTINWTGDGGIGNWEDPFIWIDQRGMWKMLSNVYPNPGQVPNFYDRVSGYSYSFDGITWVQHPWQPYTHEITHVGNVTIGYATRERPKIFFAEDRVTPLALFNGVAMLVGANCWDCKIDCGVDWTYNIAVPINHNSTNYKAF